MDDPRATNGDPTKQPRHGNRLYCLVFPDHNLFKIGLGSGRGGRSGKAIDTIKKKRGIAPGPHTEWRAELPTLEGGAWGDCERLEKVFATALKLRLRAKPAPDLGFEWFERKRPSLRRVSWEDELTGALYAALHFSQLQCPVVWTELSSFQLETLVAG